MSASRSAMPPGLVVLVLSLLLGLQPVTTDLYLPALPSITQGFGAGMPQAQLTLTALLLAFGLSQLVWGPLSDRFGRRPVLLLGTALYVLAAVGSTFSGSMAQLIVWRVLQGIAMGAGVMGARAVVRDLYAPVEGARVMSKGLTGLGVIACASAPLGGLLAELGGWRMALMALAVFGAGTLALLAWRFEETLAQKNPRALEPLTLLRTWGRILRHPTFWAFTLLSATSYGGLFTFLAASSFVFIGVLGLSKTAYGLLMLVMSLSYIVGTFACRRLLPRLGVRRTVAVAGACTLLAGSTMGLLALAGVQHTAAIMGPFILFMLGHGVHQPCGQSGAVGPFPQAAGAASAMSGFLMMVTAFFMGGWLGLSLAENPGSVRPLTDGLWFWSVAIAGTAWTLVQRHGDPAGAPCVPFPWKPTPPLAQGSRALGMRLTLASRCPSDRPIAAVRMTAQTPPVRCVALTGPTASGKSAAALAIAQRWPVEIVSVDSALVYRGMDIGTAKPSAAERAAVPHHLIDITDPLRAYSAADFVRDAQRLLADIAARGRTPLLVGGTLLYLKALTQGLDDMPRADPAVRARIEAAATAQGWPALHAQLARVDPVTAARLAPHDAQRIQRALEVFELTGRPLSALQTGAQRPARYAWADGALLSLEPMDRAWLHQRIAQRFDDMLQAGLIDEVQRLRARGDLHADLPSMRCVGYRQVWEALDASGGAPLSKAQRAALRERGIFATRQLAKRQLTWLRSMPQRRVIACDGPDALQRVLSAVNECLRPVGR